MTQREFIDTINESVDRRNNSPDMKDTTFDKEVLRHIKEAYSLRSKDQAIGYLVNVYVRTFKK